MSSQQSVNQIDAIKIKEEAFVIDSNVVYLVLISMFDSSIFLWVGDEKHKSIANLSLAVAGSSTCLMSDDVNLFSETLALKLSKKLMNNRSVYVSYNLPPCL